MEWKEIAETLPRFGLSDRETALYLACLRRGRATARELTKDAELDRVLGYRLLDRMRGRGLVEIIPERPRRYAPLSPHLLVERSLRERRARLDEDESVARQLVERLTESLASHDSRATRYQILSGSGSIFDYLEELVARARERVDVLLTYRSLRQSLDRGLGTHLMTFVRRGGRFRLLLESDPRWAATGPRIRTALRRFPSAEVRLAADQPIRLTIGDANEALLFLVPELKDRRGEQVAVWTNEPGFVAGQQRYFESAWKAGTPGLLQGRAR